MESDVSALPAALAIFSCCIVIPICITVVVYLLVRNKKNKPPHQ